MTQKIAYSVCVTRVYRNMIIAKYLVDSTNRMGNDSPISSWLSFGMKSPLKKEWIG